MAPVRKQKRSRSSHFLLRWRKYRRITQEKVAEFVGVNQSTISNLENGKTPYDQDILEKLAVLYDCAPPDLLSVDPLKPDPPKLVFERLRAAPKEVQERAIAVLETLLKVG